jgi:hypothetical protein
MRTRTPETTWRNFDLSSLDERWNHSSFDERWRLSRSKQNSSNEESGEEAGVMDVKWPICDFFRIGDFCLWQFSQWLWHLPHPPAAFSILAPHSGICVPASILAICVTAFQHWKRHPFWQSGDASNATFQHSHVGKSIHFGDLAIRMAFCPVAAVVDFQFEWLSARWQSAFNSWHADSVRLSLGIGADDLKVCLDVLGGALKDSTSMVGIAWEMGGGALLHSNFWRCPTLPHAKHRKELKEVSKTSCADDGFMHANCDDCTQPISFADFQLEWQHTSCDLHAAFFRLRFHSKQQMKNSSLFSGPFAERSTAIHRLDVSLLPEAIGALLCQNWRETKRIVGAAAWLHAARRCKQAEKGPVVAGQTHTHANSQSWQTTHHPQF